MTIKLEINAKCVNCKNWIFEDVFGNFLEAEDTFCNLTKENKDKSDECKELDFYSDSLEFAYKKVMVV